VSPKLELTAYLGPKLKLICNLLFLFDYFSFFYLLEALAAQSSGINRRGRFAVVHWLQKRSGNLFFADGSVRSHERVAAPLK